MEILKLIVCLILAILLATALSPLLAFVGYLLGVAAFIIILLEVFDRLEAKLKNKNSDYGRKW